MSARSQLRTALAVGAKPIPARWLIRAAHGRAPVARVARVGLENRAVTVPTGEAEGLVVDAGTSNVEYLLGTNEQPVQAALVGLLEPGDVCYDVGANIGFMTLIAARRVGPDGLVVAFEPSAANAELIRRNVRANGFDNVVVSCRAVSATTGIQTLQVSATSGGHSLDSAYTPPDLVDRMLVEATTLDDAITTDGLRPPDVVKIDVEGAEPAVLEGMSRILEVHRPVLVIEVDDASVDGHDRRLAEITRFVERHGYELERLPDSYPSGAWVVSHWVGRPRR